jgi:hypothetical protein
MQLGVLGIRTTAGQQRRRAAKIARHRRRRRPEDQQAEAKRIEANREAFRRPEAGFAHRGFDLGLMAAIATAMRRRRVNR